MSLGSQKKIKNRVHGAASILVSAFLLASCAQTSEPNSFVYIPRQGDAATGVYDNKTLALITTIPSNGQSIDSRMTPDRTKVFVINVTNPTVAVIRANCPKNDSDWSDAERANGECIPNTKYGTITVPDEDAGAGYISISRDGTRAYLASNTRDSIYPDSDVVSVIDTKTAAIIRRLTPPEGTIAVESSPDGKVLWAGTRDGYVQPFDSITGAVLGKKLFVNVAPATIKVSLDGSLLFTGNINFEGDESIGIVSVVDTETVELIKQIEVGPSTYILSLETSADGKQIWTANGNNTISVIDTHTLEVIKTIVTPFTTTEGVDISPDGKRVIAIGFTGAGFTPEAPSTKDSAYGIFYSTETFEALSEAIFIGDNSGGIPSMSPF